MFICFGWPKMWDTRGCFLDKKNQDIGIPPVSGLEGFEFKKELMYI